MTIVWLNDFVTVSSTSEFKSFWIDHMHWRSEVNNKFSVFRFKIWWRKQAPIYRRWKECWFIGLFYIWCTFGQLPRCFTGVLVTCLFLRQILKFWRVGAALLGQINPNKGFWSRIFGCRARAFVNLTRWIGFCMSEFFRKIDDNFGGSMSWNIHTKCRALDHWRFCRYQLMMGVMVRVGSLSDLLSRLTTGCRAFSCHSFFQYGSCIFVILFFDLLLSCPSTRRCAESIFHQISNHSSSCRTSSGGCHFFTKWIGATSFEAICARPSKQSSTWVSASRISGSRCFSLILPRKRCRRRIRLCQLCTLIHVGSEIAIVSFRTLPVGFPLPTIS